MDGSRNSDLNILYAVLNNPAESVAHKRQATRAITRIKRKMRDPFITSTRERLMKASAASDTYEAEKLSNQLIDYEQRTYGQG